MNRLRSAAALTLVAFVMVGSGCVAPEHRMNNAAVRDDARRDDFERCRAAGRSDCDTILNEPVNSNTERGDAVREQERRDAYDRCVARNGTDCDDLLHR